MKAHFSVSGKDQPVNRDYLKDPQEKRESRTKAGPEKKDSGT
jgi:hypothetical protein